jgi:hypothetical protein
MEESRRILLGSEDEDDGLVSNSYLKLNFSYAVKKVIDFPVPSRDVTYQTLPVRE